MKTIGIIAEFNPFHNGHKYMIEKCKAETGADYCIVIMSGDFVQRGAPAVADKFTRTKMALLSGADLVLELPLYYSLGSAEYFASGAISILDKLGVTDYLCFGSELGEITPLFDIAKVLCEEPETFKTVLSDALRSGESYAAAREAALLSVLENDSVKELLQSPNNILAIEYLKALLKRNSTIKPVTIKRKGEAFHSESISEYASATAIRKLLSENEISEKLGTAVPEEALQVLLGYKGKFLDSNAFSEIMNYKLITREASGFNKFLDVTCDLSNKIISEFTTGDSFTELCEKLKTKNLSYSRISRSLFHILLDVTEKNMEEYRADDYTGYLRILGLRKSSSSLLAAIHERSHLPVIDRLKDARRILTPTQLRLFNETLQASLVYDLLADNRITSEYSLKSLIL